MTVDTSQPKNNIINIGSQNSTEYVAYGDDSQIGDILVYAFAIIKRHNIAKVEDEIKKIKEFYKFPIGEPLHCRVLFHPDARRKHGLDHISVSQVETILRRIVKLINKTPVFFRYAYSNFQETDIYWKQRNNEIVLQHITNEQLKTSLSITPSAKAILNNLASLALFTKPENKDIPMVQKCQIIISEDKTKVKFCGEQKKQAHSYTKNFSDIDAPTEEIYYLDPIIAKPKEHILLELADLLAYIRGQALNKTFRQSFFQQQLKIIKYKHGCEYKSEHEYDL